MAGSRNLRPHGESTITPFAKNTLMLLSAQGALPMNLRFKLLTLGFCLVVVSSGSNIQAAQSAPPPVASGIPTVASSSARSSTITNARVVDMTQLGLDDDVIIARIKHGACDFQLSDSDLVELKKSGVSSKVVAAMLETAPVATAYEPSDGKVRVLLPIASPGKHAEQEEAVGTRTDGAQAARSPAGLARRLRKLSRP